MTSIIKGVKREGNTELSHDSDGLVMTFVEHYLVETDDPTMLMWDVMSTAVPANPAVAALLPLAGLPLPGYTQSLDGICVCKTLSGERLEENPREWRFSANWSSKVDEGNNNSDGNPSTNPETLTPSRETMSETVVRFRQRDLIDQAYVNGARHLFNPPLQVEDELPKWEFSQFEPHYSGAYSSVVTSFSALSGTYGHLIEADTTSTPGVIYPPGVYYNSGSGFTFFAPSDYTSYYFNGAINAVPFNGFPAYTLLLKVRSSKVGFFVGARRRLSEYSITYDKRNWFDKPLNAGPFFMAPELDANGNPTANSATYPYIYYQGPTESPSTDLSQEDSGPLGTRNLTLTFNPATGFLERPVTTDALDGIPSGGYQIVTKADGKKTYRAKKLSVADIGKFYNFEYVNHDLLDFNSYIRIV